MKKSESLDKGKQLNLREIQLIQIDILKKFKNICDSNNLKYYLFNGTLIGCVREKGYIPWDDDIDTVMFRSDYEKLIDYCTKHKEELLPYEIINYRTKKDYPIVITRIQNTDYCAYDENDNSYEIGPFIDIYPLDYVENSQKEKNKCVKRYKSWEGYKKYFVNHGFERSKTQLLTYIRYSFYLLYESIFTKWVSYLDNFYKNKSYKHKTDTVGILCWLCSNKSFYNVNIFEGDCFGEFEGERYRIPFGYDSALKQKYGNYLKLPPVEERKPYHMAKVYKK